MTNSRLEGKIVEFTETDWKQFPTFEHALQKWAEELLAEERAGLEAQIEKMKMCCNCDNWRGYGERLDHISYPCCQHDCDSVCPKWKLWERR